MTATTGSAGLVRVLASGAAVPPPDELRIFPGPPLALPGSLTERAITVDQTHRSVVVGEHVVVKWLSPPLPAPQRAPELLEHLAEVGFARTPRPYAALYRGTDLRALVTGFLPGALDGWEWATNDLLAELDGGPPAAIGTPLGALAGELHVALATPSSVLPTPVATSGTAGWMDQGRRAFDQALDLVDGEDGSWLAARAGRIRADLTLPPGPTAVQRLHGDLHVGQILRWDDGYAVIDFDGNPAAPQDLLEPAARDVAQLLTSIEHVAAIANKQTGHAYGVAVREWITRERAALLAAYRPPAGALLDDALLLGFETAQECRELLYAARFLPRWRYAPMEVLRRRYPLAD
ncbi:hypothetical protein [Actinoplanes sp. HUAS TT8]|uniref:hypothetical protein n=1 Tax=Actinoplanes sp. HUAS TT8 TaxID=3447453 RepID=UPI003F523339